MPGRPRSAKAKQLEGNPGKRQAHQAPTLAGVPDMPADLPEVAQQEWKRITALLAERGDLSALDRAGLADYCLCFARLVEIEQYIGGHGLLVPGLRGLVKNPALQLARQYRASLQRWADQFGLTPVSRGRLSLPEPDGNDDDLLD